MSRLESLHIEFQSPRSRPDPDNRRPTPLTRHVLHFLVWWEFKGVHEYLEDVMAWIDAPHLSELSTFFFMDLDFHVPQLHRFIGHSEELKKLKRASIAFTQGYVTVTLAQFTVNFVQLLLQIRCQESDWLLSTMAQVFHSSLPPFSSLEELVINDKSPDHQQPHWKDDMESTQWLELLDPFATVKDLYLSKGVALRLEHALQELDWERVAEVLPALQNIFVEDLEPSGLDQADLGKLVAARQLSSHPVAIHRWGPEGSLHL
ncbi:hypothetical protein F5148DRAFT_1287275 [Russula earlei]|uniref:Uncharacterized protein n=1 Tax=Russula earlei TaxID=71964 RepID=A0ACC0U246_9AGAM|nr:hypothetical protein F5148DRAFT_1287275 [Russula earlei]